MTLAIVNEINIVMLFVILKMWFEINNITAQAQVIESIGFTNNNVTLIKLIRDEIVLTSNIKSCSPSPFNTPESVTCKYVKGHIKPISFSILPISFSE